MPTRSLPTVPYRIPAYIIEVREDSDKPWHHYKGPFWEASEARQEYHHIVFPGRSKGDYRLIKLEVQAWTVSQEITTEAEQGNSA
jgi:hypothetical protein